MYTIEQGVLEGSCAYFNSPSNMAKSLFFYVNSLGHFYCDHNYKIKRDKFDSYLLMYIVAGEGLLTINNKPQPIKANDILLINCYEAHMYETNSSLETLWTHFDGNVSKDYFNLISERMGNVISSKNSTLVQDYLLTMTEDFKENKIINEAILSCNIQRMLAELLILSMENSLGNSTNSNYIEDSIVFIRDNFKNKISLEDISANVCMSPFHFSRIFKRETGYSPYEYVTMLRLNHAKTLLKTTNLLIKEIAFECGFNSETNFVIAFRNHTNLAPSKFRKIPF
jgi:AraC family transcriptional regulator